MGSLNINSLFKHIDETRILKKDNNFDILAINETKLDQFDSDSFINISVYTCIRKNRNKDGGGVCIYIRDTIDFKRKLSFEQGDLEMISIKVSKPNTSPFLLTTWYRPPKSSHELFHQFETFLKKADSEYNEYYVLGDVHYDLMAANLEAHTLKLIDILDIYQLTQLIDEPTRVTENSKTLIDHVITNSTKIYFIMECHLRLLVITA